MQTKSTCDKIDLDRSRLYEMRVKGRYVGMCDPFAGLVIIQMFGQQVAFDLAEMRRKLNAQKVDG